MTTPSIWGTDVPISLPTPDDSDMVSVPMGGFKFTPNGIAHEVTSADLEDQYTAPFRPEDVPPPEQRVL